MEKYGFVYIWYDRKHKRYYVGAHWGKEDDGYLCSSNWMRDSYKRRPSDFKRRIICRVSDKQELFIKEQNYLQFIKDQELGKRYYNLNKHDRNHWKGAITKQKNGRTELQRQTSIKNLPKGKRSADAINKQIISTKNRWSVIPKKKHPDLPAKMSQIKSKSYTLRNPDGEIITIVGLAAFARSNGLCEQSLRHVASGRRKSYKGWMLS